MSRLLSGLRLGGGENAAGLVDSLLLIAARVGATLLALVWTLLLVRLLAPDLSGIVFQAIAIAQIGSILLTLNVESGAVRTLVPAVHAGRLDEAAGFIRFNRRMILMTAPLLVLATILWMAGPAPGGTGPLAPWVAAAMVMAALARMTARHATALGVMRRGLMPRLMTAPIVLTLGLGIAAMSGFAVRPWHVLALFALSEALTVVIQNRLLRSALDPFRDVQPTWAGWRDWIGLGLWLSPGLLLTEYRKALLIAAAGLVLSPGQLSLFAVAFSIINIINFGVVAVDVAFSPRIAAAMAAGHDRRRDRMLGVSAAIKVAGLAIGTGLVAVMGRWALGWFGPEYGAAWPAMLVLLLIPALSILFGPASMLLSARGQGRADCAANLIGAVVTVAAIWLGSSLWALTGAALGAVIGHLVTLALMTALCRRRLRIDPSLASLRHLRPGAAATAVIA